MPRRQWDANTTALIVMQGLPGKPTGSITPMLSESLCYARTPCGETFQERLFPFDCNEVRCCLLLGRFPEESLLTP
jgi:hypothetical protein